MVCDEPDECFNCENVYEIPWTQDLDDGFNLEFTINIFLYLLFSR